MQNVGMSDFVVQKTMSRIRWTFSVFEILRNQAKTKQKICVQALSISLSLFFFLLSLSLSLYDLPSKFANSLDPEVEKNVQRFAYQELI